MRSMRGRGARESVRTAAQRQREDLLRSSSASGSPVPPHDQGPLHASALPSAIAVAPRPGGLGLPRLPRMLRMLALDGVRRLRDPAG